MAAEGGKEEGADRGSGDSRHVCLFTEKNELKDTHPEILALFRGHPYIREITDILFTFICVV